MALQSVNNKLKDIRATNKWEIKEKHKLIHDQYFHKKSHSGKLSLKKLTSYGDNSIISAQN